MTVEGKPFVEAAANGRLQFRMVDLSHPISFHTPGWVGYPGMRLYYTQTLQTNRVVSQRIETSLHVGTHLDAPLHFAPGGKDMASIPLERLLRSGGVRELRGPGGPRDEVQPPPV